VRKSRLPLKKLYTFVSHFLKRVSPNRQAKKKGRPRKYEDTLIITLWLFQVLNNYSYRETLEKAKNEGFNVPSLCDYHYRVKKLDDELLKSILEEWKMSTFGLHRLDWLIVCKRFLWNAKYETVYRWLASLIVIYTIMKLKS
jgi:hypothetical protein